jgi:hypothetical protein
MPSHLCYIGYMKQKEFYETCALILGVKHDYREPPPVPKMPDREGNIRNTYKGRYNGREGGNGRFPGSGIVRDFGTFIQVRLTTPLLHGNYPNYGAALEAITKAMAAHVAVVAEQIQQDREQALTDNPVGYRIAGPEEIDLARRQLRRGNQVAAAMVKARMMTPEECAEMEAATLAAHVEIDELLKERTTQPYHERRREAERQKALDELAEQAQELKMGYE